MVPHARVLARELSHRMKNMFAVISGIVNVMGRVRGVESEAAEINSRIHALGRAYETTLDEASEELGTIQLPSSWRATMEEPELNPNKRQGIEQEYEPRSPIRLEASAAHRLDSWWEDFGRTWPAAEKKL